MSEICGLLAGHDHPFGVHLHNNLGLALYNSIVAEKAGATWIDCTVTGMGRGPGNTLTEELLAFRAQGRDVAELSGLVDFIERRMTPMQRQYNYGKNFDYFLSALNRIHPTYSQQLQSNKLFTATDRLSVYDEIRKGNARVFSKDNLESSSSIYSDEVSGCEVDRGSLFGERAVLVLGGGEINSLGVQAFIKRENPIVIDLNNNNPSLNEVIDYRVISNPERLAGVDFSKYSSAVPIITPWSMLKTKPGIGDKSIVDIGIKLSDESVWHGSFVSAPSFDGFSYISAILTGYKDEIFIAGISPVDEQNIMKINQAIIASKLRVISLGETTCAAERSINPFVE
jgi:4-hydroxy 2-oxovalerate aldolase